MGKYTRPGVFLITKKAPEVITPRFALPWTISEEYGVPGLSAARTMLFDGLWLHYVASER